MKRNSRAYLAVPYEKMFPRGDAMNVPVLAAAIKERLDAILAEARQLIATLAALPAAQ